MPGLAGGHGRLNDHAVRIVDVHALLIERHEERQRALSVDRSRLRGGALLGLVAPLLFLRRSLRCRILCDGGNCQRGARGARKRVSKMIGKKMRKHESPPGGSKNRTRGNV